MALWPTRDWRELQRQQRARADRDAARGLPPREQLDQCTDVQSDCIATMARANDGTVYVTFRSGGRYAYYGMSPEAYTSWCHAESKGKWFHRAVRGHYPFAKLG